MSVIRQPPFEFAGKYRITRVLGRGGMGVVYEAWHEALGRHVAIKMLLSELVEDPAFIARFRQEARTVAALAHPGIVQIHDVVEDDGRIGLVMEYLQGAPLDEWLIQEKGTTLGVILQLMTQIAEALAFCHARGVIHRDLKPPNIMIAGPKTEEETASTARPLRAKLMDFGVAKSQQAQVHTTQGKAIGTPRYMSPEQLQSGKGVGPAADIYALGCILYEVSTGRAPFEETDAIVLALAHLRQPPASPRVYRKALPEPLEELMLRCLEKRPENRPSTAGEIAEQLRELGRQFSADQLALRIEPLKKRGGTGEEDAGSSSDSGCAASGRDSSGDNRPIYRGSTGVKDVPDFESDLGDHTNVIDEDSVPTVETPKPGQQALQHSGPEPVREPEIADEDLGFSAEEQREISASRRGTPPRFPTGQSSISMAIPSNPRSFGAFYGVLILLILLIGGIGVALAVMHKAEQGKGNLPGLTPAPPTATPAATSAADQPGPTPPAVTTPDPVATPQSTAPPAERPPGPLPWKDPGGRNGENASATPSEIIKKYDDWFGKTSKLLPSMGFDDFEEAVETAQVRRGRAILTEGLTYYPDSPELQDKLARHYLLLGNREAAIRQYRELSSNGYASPRQVEEAQAALKSLLEN